MARRASSSFHPGILIGLAAVVLVAVFAGKSLISHRKTSFGDLSPLRLQELLENGDSLRGNQYLVSGEIDEKLRWTADRGQVVSVKVSPEHGDGLIGIEIPPQFNGMNIDPKQRYAFRIRFRQGGIAEATGIERL